MSTAFSGTGNLGATPSLRTVRVDGEARTVAELRIFFDRRVRQADGSYADQGGFWVSVSLWGWRATAAAKLLPKGARVFARGSLRVETWDDDQGERHSQWRLDAEYLTVDLVCVEQLRMRPKGKSWDRETLDTDAPASPTTPSDEA